MVNATDYYPNVTVTEPIDILTNANTVTGGHFGWMVIAAAFTIAFLNLRHRGLGAALATSGIISTVLAYLFFALGLIEFHITIVTALLTLLGLFLANKRG